MLTSLLACAQANGRQVEVRVGRRGAQRGGGGGVVVVGPAHAHADALKHDRVERHGVGRLLHCAQASAGARGGGAGAKGQGGEWRWMSAPLRAGKQGRQSVHASKRTSEWRASVPLRAGAEERTRRKGAGEAGRGGCGEEEGSGRETPQPAQAGWCAGTTQRRRRQPGQSNMCTPACLPPAAATALTRHAKENKTGAALHMPPGPARAARREASCHTRRKRAAACARSTSGA